MCTVTRVCIPRSWQCDGTGDCPHSEDEANCSEYICQMIRNDELQYFLGYYENVSFVNNNYSFYVISLKLLSKVWSNWTYTNWLSIKDLQI